MVVLVIDAGGGGRCRLTMVVVGGCVIDAGEWDDGRCRCRHHLMMLGGGGCIGH